MASGMTLCNRQERNLLISPDYQAQQRAMHDDKKIRYGSTASKYGETISELVNLMEVKHLLDYGCGRRRSLMETFKPDHECRVQCYDPGVPEYADPPKPAEMVVCIDVLEHIEPEFIDDVLDHLEDLTEKFLFATVCTSPAGKTLPDGRNAHLIQKPVEWWLPKIMERFALKGFNQRDVHGFEVLCLPKGAFLRNGWGFDANRSGFEHF